MEQINLGAVPDGAGGDSVRVAFEKCNDNFKELAEQVGSGGGGTDHTQELEQIKEAAAALAARVKKLEQAAPSPGPAPGGPDHTQELEQLKQQLQQLQQTITTLEQTSTDAKQKAEAAQETAGRANGTAAAAQQAAQEASSAAQAAQQAARDKADKSHKHSAQDITGLDESVAAAVAASMGHQSLQGFDVVKLPDGTQIVTGKVTVQNHNNLITPRSFTWPVAFISPPVVTATVAGTADGLRDVVITIHSQLSTNKVLHYWLYEPYVTPNVEVVVHFIAIGRWK